jgi:CheY-like chemotaxis protein
MHIISLLNGKIEIKNDNIDNLSERMTTNIKIKFNIFNENIDDDLIKDYFYNKKILVLNNNKKRRIELLKLFKKINMNITITASFDEMIEYMEIDNLYEIILINYSDIEHSDIINFYKIKDDKPKILTINNNDNIEENILYDYKLENPFYYEDVLKILHLIYTINKFELENFKSEIINNNILYKLDKFDNNKIKNTNVKILIVDDNNQNQQFMKYILKFKKLYNVDNAEDGKEAYEKMIINDYDFVILDIKIPIYDGFTVVKKYKEKYPDKKIFITTMTSNPTEKIKKECFDLKINAFLPKPINIDDLDKIINLMFKTL